MDRKFPCLLFLILILSSIVAAQYCTCCAMAGLLSAPLTLFIIFLSFVFVVMHLIAYRKERRKEIEGGKSWTRAIKDLFNAILLIMFIIVSLLPWIIEGNTLLTLVLISTIFIGRVLWKRKEKAGRKSSTGITINFLVTSFIPLIMIAFLIWVHWYPYADSDEYEELFNESYTYSEDIELIWFFRWFSLAVSFGSLGLLAVILKIKERMNLVNLPLSLASMVPVIFGIITLLSGVLSTIMLCGDLCPWCQ